MDHEKNEMTSAVEMTSREYLSIPHKAYTYFLSIMSGHIPGPEYASLRNHEEETMVGYESSWAGIYKYDHMQQ